MKVAILVAVLGERDAIGTDAREMAEALRRHGHEARIYAASSPAGDAEPLAALEPLLDDPAVVLVYHFAFGWPPGVDILRRAHCRRVVRYHNVTPPGFFSGWSSEYERVCGAGRDEVATIAGLGCELYLGDSPFNIDDLLAAGVARERTAVVAPFNRLDRLVERPADLDLLDALAHDGTTWLAVGRLAPNKAHLALLDAFAVYLDRCDAHARLLVVGGEDPRLERYNAAIRERVSASSLGAHVRFLHDVRDDQLKAAYLRADAFVSLSAHEGFCVPLVEAMALGVPVVARAAGAQPWTLGGAGLVWDDPDPALVAASVERLRGDGALRHALRERGLRRVAEAFAPRVLERQLLECLEGLS